MKQTLLAVQAAALALLLPGCIAEKNDNDTKIDIGILATKMVNLSQAVDLYFFERSTAPTISDTEILRLATEHDPSLLAEEFSAYQLKTQYQNHHAVLLLCTQDGKKALLEDVGCSAPLERQAQDDAACEFTLIVSADCEVQKAAQSSNK